MLNIFIGDMSVIGPRPQTEDCFNKFLKNDQKIISKLKPGLSGIGPIIFRNEEEILDINVNEKISMIILFHHIKVKLSRGIMKI